MKRYILTLTLTLALASGFGNASAVESNGLLTVSRTYSMNEQREATPAPMRTYNVKIGNSGSSFSEQTLFVRAGAVQPLFRGNEITYVASCDNSGPEARVEAGKLSTGIFLMVAPSADNADLVSFRFNIADLVQMNKISQGGCEFEVPQVQTNEGASDVMLAVGRSATFSGGPYTVTLTRTE